MKGFKKRVDILDREAWVLAVVVRAIQMARCRQDYDLAERAVDRICAYVKGRFGSGN